MSIFDKFNRQPTPPDPPPDPEIPRLEGDFIAWRGRRMQKDIYRQELQKQIDDVVMKRLRQKQPELYDDSHPDNTVHHSSFLNNYAGGSKYSPLTDIIDQAPKYIKLLQKIVSKLKTHQQELTDRLNKPLTEQEQKEYDKQSAGILSPAKTPNPKSERAITEKENEAVVFQLERHVAKLAHLTAHYQNYCTFVCQALLDHHKSDLQPDHIKLLKHRLTEGVNFIKDFEQELNNILKNNPDQPVQPTAPDPNLTLGDRYPEPDNPLTESLAKKREAIPWAYYVSRVPKGELGIRNPFLLDEALQKKLAWAMVFKRKYQRPPTRFEWEEWEAENQPDETVVQAQNHRDRHTYIIGKSGSGKTTLMRQMIYQDLKNGAGLAVVAPEQEMLTEQILPFIPEHRIDDVIYFNPADDNPVPFNPLNLEPDEDPHLKANEVMTIFQRVIGAENTPRIGQILYQAFYALITTPNTTLLDIRKLLNRENPDFRHQIVSQLQDEEAIEFWRDEYPQYPKEAHVPILYRVSPFTRDKRVRNTLCRTGQSLNFRQVMDTGKIVLFNLSDGILGESTSQLFGQLIVSQIQQAAISRADTPAQQLRRFYLYIDEFQTFTNTATSSYEKILSRARKYRLALILAHQQTGQIPDELLRDIFGNVSTMVGFTVSHRDANKLSKEFLINGETTPPERFINLQIGETYCKLGRESFKMKTYQPDEEPNFKRAQQILDHSKNLFTDSVEPELASTETQTQPKPQPPPSTKPRIKPTGKIK